MNVRDKVVLERRTRRQPQPHVREGGDCAACMLAGLMEMDIDEVYEHVLVGETGTSRVEMQKVLEMADLSGQLRVITDIPQWSVPSYYMAFGPSGYVSHPEWFRYVRMALEAGYYGICSVCFDQRGSGGQIPPETDHVVLVCGARTVEVPHPTLKASRLDNEILVSCSAKSSPDDEWVEVREFLLKRGGYNVILAKPMESSP